MWSLVVFGILYAVAGFFALRFGPWETKVESLIVEARIRAAKRTPQPAPLSRGEPVNWLEARVPDEQPMQWKWKLASTLLTAGALALWPLCLHEWWTEWWTEWAKKRAHRKAEEAALWKVKGRVSTCPQKLSFRCHGGRPLTVFGTIYFSAADCEAILRGQLEEDPDLRAGENETLLTWLQHRDPLDTETARISGFWLRSQYLVADLVRGGLCRVRCEACERTFPGSDCEVRDWNAFIPAPGHFRGGGSAGHSIVCPQGHTLTEIMTRMA